MVSIIHWKHEVTHLLLDEMGIQDNDGWTAVMHAIAQDDLKAFDLLHEELQITNL